MFQGRSRRARADEPAQPSQAKIRLHHVEAEGKFKRRTLTHEEPAAVAVTATPAPVAPVVEERGFVDPRLEYAERYGVKAEDLLLLDKLVTTERYKPRVPGTTGRVDHLLHKLRTERYLTTQGLGRHLHKTGLASIWVKQNGSAFYGSEAMYLTHMRKPDVETALSALANDDAST